MPEYVGRDPLATDGGLRSRCCRDVLGEDVLEARPRHDVAAELALHLKVRNSGPLLSYLRGSNQLFFHVVGGEFRRETEDPVTTFALLSPNDEGQFAYVQFRGFSNTLKRIPAWMAIGELGLAAWVALAMATIVLYAPFWMLGGLVRRHRRPHERWIRIWPLVAVLSVVAEQLIVGPLASGNPVARLGNLTPWSIGVFIATFLVAVAPIANTVALWRARGPEVRRAVRYHSIAVTSALLVNAAYLGIATAGEKCWKAIAATRPPLGF